MYLFDWYRFELYDGEPMTYQKIYYWNVTMDKRCEPWEVEVLLMFDRLKWASQMGDTND